MVIGSKAQRSAAEWLEDFARAVRARDYAAARSYFDEDVLGFGTVVPRAEGLDRLEADQWRAVWDVTTAFAFHAPRVVELDAVAFVAAEWSSTYVVDGSRRRGRATIILRHAEGGWRAVHSHFSLEPSGQLR